MSCVLQQLKQATFFLCCIKDTLKEESSVNVKIFICLEDLHTRLPGLTMPDFSVSVTSMTRFGTYPVMHMQSTNMTKVRTTITRMQTYYRAYDPKCFLFHERLYRKCVSVSGYCFDKELDANVF